MKLETILHAAKHSMILGHHEPHCCDSPITQLDRRVQNEIDNIGFATAYAEPGYTDPDKGIVLADWNCFPSQIGRVLERAGYAIEWSDEWDTCCECNKAVRISPDSYGWASHYRILNECEIVCLDCLDPVEYLESIEDDARSAVPPGDKFNPEKNGYTKYNGDFETGFHQGQNDNPEKILKAMHEDGKSHVVFRIAGKGQFDITWEAFYKLQIQS